MLKEPMMRNSTLSGSLTIRFSNGSQLGGHLTMSPRLLKECLDDIDTCRPHSSSDALGGYQIEMNRTPEEHVEVLKRDVRGVRQMSSSSAAYDGRRARAYPIRRK